MLLYESVSELEDIKPDIKQENDVAFGIVEVMVENDEEISQEDSDIFRNITKTRSAQLRNFERRSYKRKKNLDEGLTVVEVDGQKIYQCEICKKLCKGKLANDSVFI